MKALLQTLFATLFASTLTLTAAAQGRISPARLPQRLRISQKAIALRIRSGDATSSTKNQSVAWKPLCLSTNVTDFLTFGNT